VRRKRENARVCLRAPRGNKKEGDRSMAWVVEKVSSHLLRACSAQEDDKKEGYHFGGG
jgi:hypothetical protein